MKKYLILGIIALIVFVSVGAFLDYFSDNYVYHKDTGLFINTDDISPDKITMLHWYAGEFEMYSASDMELSFAKFNLKSAINIYVNKSIVLQNHTKEIEKFSAEDYLRFNIRSNDYKANKVKILMDIVPSNKNVFTSFFVGTPEKMNNFLITKKNIDFAVLSILILSLVLILIADLRNRYACVYVASFLIMLLDFQIGLACVFTAMFFVQDNLLKRKHKGIAFVVIFFINSILPIKVYVSILILLKMYDYYKKQSKKTAVAIISFISFFAVTVYDFEFSLFRIFYEDIYMMLFAIVSYVYSMYCLSGIYRDHNNISINLLRGISHDFKIPISVMKINMEMISSDEFDTEAKRNKIIHSSNLAINDMEKMAGSLTAYLAKGDYVSSEYRSSLTKCFEKMKRSFDNRTKQINFVVYCDDEEVFLNIDEIWLDRLIYNLLDNAFKYTEDYGTVKLSYEKKGNHVIITVEDEGIGMTKEEVEKSMIPFYRADKSRSISGLGLGLSIIQNIVDKLDGDIQIYSQKDKGTKIVIRI